MFSKASVYDFENLCILDDLGVKNIHIAENETFYDEFKKQLGRSEEGRFETSLMWKETSPHLKTLNQGVFSG